MRISEFSQKKLAFGLLLVLLTLYTLFQARFLLLGPQLTILEPLDGSTHPSGVLQLKGTAKNVAFISLNDRPIFLDSNGNWNEKLIAYNGLTVYTVKARDRFGRESAKTLTLLIN